MEGSISVTPDSTIYLYVGGKGATGQLFSISLGGFNGGGNSTYFYSSFGGGGGGGASDIRIGGTALTNRIVVAGGGGGQGFLTGNLFIFSNLFFPF